MRCLVMMHFMILFRCCYYCIELYLIMEVEIFIVLMEDEYIHLKVCKFLMLHLRGYIGGRDIFLLEYLYL